MVGTDTSCQLDSEITPDVGSLIGQGRLGLGQLRIERVV